MSNEANKAGKDTVPAATPSPKPVPKAPQYRIKGGADVIGHPAIGEVTKDHLAGPNAEIFIRAFRAHDKKTGGRWFEKHIEIVK